MKYKLVVRNQEVIFESEEFLKSFVKECLYTDDNFTILSYKDELEMWMPIQVDNLPIPTKINPKELEKWYHEAAYFVPAGSKIIQRDLYGDIYEYYAGNSSQEDLKDKQDSFVKKALNWWQK